jgi:hypothetical protein
MKSFNQYIEDKKMDAMLDNIASLMVEMDIEPTSFILDYVSNDPKMEAALLEYIELQEGILDGIKSFAGRAVDAAKAVGGSIWRGGGLGHGIDQAKDIMSGPAAKFDTAKRALTDLVLSLKKGYKDANNNTVSFSSIPSSADPKHNIVQVVNKLLKVLEREHGNMPKLLAAQVSAPTMSPRGPAPAPAPAP